MIIYLQFSFSKLIKIKSNFNVLVLKHYLLKPLVTVLSKGMKSYLSLLTMNVKQFKVFIFFDFFL